MSTLRRVRSVWTGFPGAPGVTTMYFLDTDTAVNELHTMWTALSTIFPTDVHIQVENTGDTIEDTTGELTGTWPASDPVGVVVGTDALKYAAPTGCMVNWKTDTVLDGRRLRGRSFLVPAAAIIFDTDGSIASGTLASIRTAVDNFAGSQVSSFVVYRRPRKATPADGSRKAVTARAGGHGLVTSVTVPDKAIVLRSRRD